MEPCLYCGRFHAGDCRRPNALVMMREDWRRVIYDATGDMTQTTRALELAELNGLFDPFKASTDINVDSK